MLRSSGHPAVLRHVHRHHHGASQDHNRQTSALIDLTTRKFSNTTTKLPIHATLVLAHETMSYAITCRWIQENETRAFENKIEAEPTHVQDALVLTDRVACSQKPLPFF